MMRTITAGQKRFLDAGPGYLSEKNPDSYALTL
jgi:hypothetical protein